MTHGNKLTTETLLRMAGIAVVSELSSPLRQREAFLTFLSALQSGALFQKRSPDSNKQARTLLPLRNSQCLPRHLRMLKPSHRDGANVIDAYSLERREIRHVCSKFILWKYRQILNIYQTSNHIHSSILLGKNPTLFV